MTGAETHRSGKSDYAAQGSSRPVQSQQRRLFAVALVVGCGTVLAGCSAHQRQAAASPQPTEAQIADVSLTTAQTPVPQPGAAGQATAMAIPATKGATVAAASPGAPKIGKSGAGLASWYGDRFHGRRTANGERFDMAAFTAAHKSFPLPSYVRVTNVNNGRSIVVRVNDRGPYHAGRVIDVSKRAADVLGFRGNGVGNVKLDFVGKAPERSDDNRLLASYQEFGRPALAPGMQVASLAPVSDSELAAENAAPAGAYAVASRAMRSSADYVVASAEAVGSGAKSAAIATAATANTVVRKMLPTKQPAAPVAVASAAPAPASQPTASAYAPPEPLLASAPDAITSPKASHGKRVVEPQPLALASAGPALRPSLSGSDVSSRIASTFEGFGGGQTTAATGGSVAVETTR